MTAREQDEARDAAWREYMARYGYGTVPGWQDTGADFAAGWDARNAEVASLTAQLHAAQAAIERARHESIAGEGRSSVVLSVVRDILSRADTSALAERDKQMKAEGWNEACQGLAWCFDNGPERDALPYLIEHNPFRAASIEQEGADRG